MLCPTVSGFKLAPQNIWRPLFVVAGCTPEPLTSSLVLQLLLLWERPVETLGAILRRGEVPMLLHLHLQCGLSRGSVGLSLASQMPLFSNQTFSQRAERGGVGVGKAGTAGVA